MPIICFEWIFSITLTVSIVRSGFSWGTLAHNGMPLVLAVVIPVAIYILKLVLVFLVSRKRNRLALWILVGLTALALLSSIYVISMYGLTAALVTLLATPLIQSVGLMLLFLPVSQQWLKPRQEVGSLEDTFL